MSLRRRRDVWDVVVVGGGIGGLTAAWYCARRGMPTALLGGQVATVNAIDDWPSAHEVSGVELAMTMNDKLGNNSVEVSHDPVESVHAGGANGLVLVKTRRRFSSAGGPRSRAACAFGNDRRAFAPACETCLRRACC